MDGLNEKRQVWLEYIEISGKAVVSMNAYAESHDLELPELERGGSVERSEVEHGPDSREGLPRLR